MKQKCQARCRNGLECLNYALPESNYCFTHQDTITEDEENKQKCFLEIGNKK